MRNDDAVSQVSDDLVLAEDGDGVRLLTLNRPDTLNALSWPLLDAIRAALQAAADDDEVRCVALTGSGRAFTAGSDISGSSKDMEDPWQPFISRVETFPKPLVVAVNGLAVGFGTTILCHCDLSLAGASARFKMPFASLGLVPEVGSTFSLPGLMGRYAATHAFLTGGWISSEDALAQGLVWRTTSDEELLAETWAVCREIAAAPLESVVNTKRLLLDARLPDTYAARMREEPIFTRLQSGPAHLAALAKFQEKRK